MTVVKKDCATTLKKKIESGIFFTLDFFTTQNILF